jgi:cysteine-rich repeat protein
VGSIGRCEPFNLDGCDWDCEDECGDGYSNKVCYNPATAQIGGACDDSGHPYTCDAGWDCVEECDDGNIEDGDGCTAACGDEFCGDGAVNDDPSGNCDASGTPGAGCEQCDDGRQCVDGDDNVAYECVNSTGVGTGVRCTPNDDTGRMASESDDCGEDELCDRFLCGGADDCDGGETCEALNDDGCDTNCELECGNDQDDGIEECDDGNLVNGDGCDSQCHIEECGNGYVQVSAVCLNTYCDRNKVTSCESDDDCTGGLTCRPWAELGGDPACEQCDDGNTGDGDGCDASCQLECGNAVVDAGEQCDPGHCSDNISQSCSSHADCSNGAVCEGNTINGDGCDANCTTSACGNGILAGDEVCDDGNTSSGDGCDSVCASECGNGAVNGAEECDDGNSASGDGCYACYDECGNCLVDSDETCDDGNRDSGDGCDNDCAWE